MRKLILVLVVCFLSACAKPSGQAEKILDTQMVMPNAATSQSTVLITRQEQSALLTSSMGVCPFLISIDDKKVALLRENQFVTVYLDEGSHSLRVGNNCKLVGFGISKTIKIETDGKPLKFSVKENIWGQYDIQQVN